MNSKILSSSNSYPDSAFSNAIMGSKSLYSGLV